MQSIRRYPFWPDVVRFRRNYLLGMTALLGVDTINVCLPLVLGAGIDAVIGKSFTGAAWAGSIYLLLMGLQAWGRWAWRIYLIGTSHAIARDRRLQLYRHLQRLPLSYYQEVRTGDLMSRATNDIESIRMAVGPGILVTVDAILVFCLIVPVMFYQSWKLSLLAFAFYPAVPWITARIGDRIDVLFEGLQERMSQMGAFIQESFAGIRLIKSLVLENRVHERFEHLSEAYRIDGIRQAKFQAGFTPILGLLTNLGTFLILLVGGWDVMQGVITVGTFVAFQRFVVQLSWPMEAIGWAVTMNREGLAAARRLAEILSSPQVTSVRMTHPIKLPPRPSTPLLEARDLRYGYPVGGGTFRLDIGEIRILPSQKIGIVGPVGAGKTTLFNLLLRLYEPEPGQVFFLGNDVTAVPLEELRRRIASVEQQVFLFSEEVATNVRLGLGNRVSDDEVERAARTACIYDEILAMEKGFSTVLGERGVNLSGGQKQRLALMRALVRSPQLLVLDDSFSAVDVEAESHIIDNFFSEYPSLAVCFASHRLSVMPRMDEVWLMHGGAIVDRGEHHQLLRENALYQELWERSERKLEAERFEAVAHEGGML